VRGLVFGAGLLASLALAGVVGLAVLTLASRTVRVKPALTTGSTATAQYAGGLGTSGFAIEVQGTERHLQVAGVPAAPADLHSIRVHVTFTNTSRRQQRANLPDFSLYDATGAVRPPVAGGHACPAWPMTDLHATGNDSEPPRDVGAQQTGPSFGPVPVCFQVAGDPDGELRLRWDPDVSIAFLSSPVEVMLR